MNDGRGSVSLADMPSSRLAGPCAKGSDSNDGELASDDVLDPEYRDDRVDLMPLRGDLPGEAGGVRPVDPKLRELGPGEEERASQLGLVPKCGEDVGEIGSPALEGKFGHELEPELTIVVIHARRSCALVPMAPHTEI